jgi:HAD superfamily hydrolase (TIGR01509 family)
MDMKALFFDVGGVLLRTEDHTGRRLWEEKLGLAAGGAEFAVFNSEMGRKAQLGGITTEELWAWIGREYHLSPGELTQFRHDFWRGDRVDQELVRLIRRLHGRYPLGIISNYADCLRAELTDDMGIADAFDAIIISAEVGVTKPDAEIFQRALAALDVPADQSVFIDDFAHNIAGAQAVGMHGIHFQLPIDLEAELRKLGFQPD